MRGAGDGRGAVTGMRRWCKSDDENLVYRAAWSHTPLATAALWLRGVCGEMWTQLHTFFVDLFLVSCVVWYGIVCFYRWRRAGGDAAGGG